MAGYFSKLIGAIFGRYYTPANDITRSYIRSPLQDAKQDWTKYTRENQVRLIRHFEQTTGIVNRLADLFESYTVGVGLQLNPASSVPDWNVKAMEAWGRWSDNADVISRQSFGTLCSLISRSWFIDGECFVIKEDPGEGGNRPRLRLVESHRVSTPQDMQGDASVIDGIRVDSRKRPTTYYVSEDLGGGKVQWEGIPAEKVEHIFEPSRISQYRGIPFLTPVLRHLHDLDDLQAYEMSRARDNSQISNILKTESGEVNQSPLMMKFRGNQTSTIGSGATITEERIDYVRQSLGGRTVALKTNESLEQHRTDQPGAATMDYWRMLKEEICTGAGIPYVLVYPGSMQGTVFRGALDAADAFFRARSSVIQAFARRIYEWAMRWESRDAMLRPLPSDWFKVTIHPPRSVKVDIGYDSAAAIAEINAGLCSYDMVYGPRGLDWRQQFDRLNEQRKYAKDIGLELTAAPKPEKPAEEKPATNQPASK